MYDFKIFFPIFLLLWNKVNAAGYETWSSSVTWSEAEIVGVEIVE